MLNLTMNLSQLQLFFLVFLRVGALVFTLPVFDSRQIPIVFKAGLALSLGWLIMPAVPLPAPAAVDAPLAFGMAVFGEVLLGAAVGFAVRLLFAGVQLAGQVAGFQMGFAIVNVLDPITQSQASVVGQIKNLMAMLLFLAVGAHHWLLRAVIDSFTLVPPLTCRFGSPMAEGLIALVGNMFVVAVKIGAPIMAALLLTTVALGLVARTVPQMQIFMVAMPVKIIIGMVFLGLMFPYMAVYLGQLFAAVITDARMLMIAAGG